MSDDGPGADQQLHEVDELAQGLPGLPVEIGRVRVDEAGFHRKGVDVPWRDIVNLNFEAGRVHVFGAGKDGRQRRLMSLVAWWHGRREVREAWAEYLLRTIRRDDALRGSAVASPLRAAATLAFCAFALAFNCGVGVFYWGIWGKWKLLQFGGPPRASLAFFVILAALLAYVIAVWFGAVVIFARLLVVEIAMGKEWRRWSLTRQGLVLGADGGDTQLSFGSIDHITAHVIRIGGRAVPIRRLSGLAVVVPLMLALGERAGGRLRLGMPYWMMATSGVMGLLFVGAVSRADGVAAGVATAALYAIFLCILAWLFSTLLRRKLASGRAMLERLGW